LVGTYTYGNNSFKGFEHAGDAVELTKGDGTGTKSYFYYTGRAANLDRYKNGNGYSFNNPETGGRRKKRATKKSAKKSRKTRRRRSTKK